MGWRGEDGKRGYGRVGPDSDLEESGRAVEWLSAEIKDNCEESVGDEVICVRDRSGDGIGG